MHPHLSALERRYPDLEGAITSIEAAYKLLAESFRAGGKLLVCGNGGSAADADHIVGELMKGFELKRPVNTAMRARLEAVAGENAAYLADHLQGALPAIALSGHAALSSAISNDTAADMTFAQQVFGYGKPGDTLIGISTSGNSRSVINALQVARALGLRTIGLTGQTGGAMIAFCDIAICVPYTRTLEVQERHLPIYHTICTMLEAEFFE